MSEKKKMGQQRIKCDETGSEIEMQGSKSRRKALTRVRGRGDREEESSWNRERNAGKGKKKEKGADLCNISFNSLLLFRRKNILCTHIISVLSYLFSTVLISAMVFVG